MDNILFDICVSHVNSQNNLIPMYSVANLPVSEKGFVSTVHILSGGEIVHGFQDFLKIESRFAWVDKKFLVSRILELQRKTDDRRRSFLVLYEEGNQIREFVNMDYNFQPLPYC